MLTRGASKEQISEVTAELEKPLPGQAKSTPTPEERKKVHDEWAAFMQQVS